MSMEKFHFTHNEDKFSIPYITNIKSGVKADLLEGFDCVETRPHVLYRAIFAIAKTQSDGTEDAIRDMTDEEFSEFTQGWLKSTPGVSGK